MNLTNELLKEVKAFCRLVGQGSRQIMKSKIKKSFILIVIGSTFLVASCQDKGRSGLPRIKDFSTSSGATDSFCGQLIADTDVLAGDTSVCLSECDTGFHVGDQTELDSLTTEITDSGVTDETKNFLVEIIDAAAGICFIDEVVRPSGQVFINRDFCSCLNGKIG